ncbi:SitI3 family protein [Anabaena sp. UHCC 0399]|uniref:SitI3 family protein n=1 Tax=Anabaena sp. UHCC 0399 TaxID=3110238 RepID=UPI002B208C88|nr:SitI3 family protein [Anabaena sp. UHCC 0399]MEA5567632.1 SitI3 family protein [Anabaena sp. UHCC 0399]
MALSYGLELETDLSPKQVLHILAQKLDLKWQQETLHGSGVMINSHIEDEDNQLLFAEKLGYNPSVFVGFRVNPNQDFEEGMRTMIRACMNLLTQIKGNAVLLFNYETIVFQRINHELIFNQEMREPWIDAEMTNLNTPYKLQSLVSPLL